MGGAPNGPVDSNSNTPADAKVYHDAHAVTGDAPPHDGAVHMDAAVQMDAPQGPFCSDNTMCGPGTCCWVIACIPGTPFGPNICIPAN